MSVFGFSTEAGTGGEGFVPICKYDSRAGRIFRLDRKQDASGSWLKEEVDITNGFKALFDLENVETGWANFPTGAAPSFVLAPMGQPLPARPSGDFKNAVRFMIRLANECGGDAREVASSARAFLGGLEQLYLAYQEGLKTNAGKLPIVALKTTVPIKSEGGGKVSTNYAPVFEIVGWAVRPADFVFVPKAAKPAAAAAPAPAAATPPSTGSTVVGAPAPAALESSFG